MLLLGHRQLAAFFGQLLQVTIVGLLLGPQRIAPLRQLLFALRELLVGPCELLLAPMHRLLLLDQRVLLLRQLLALLLLKLLLFDQRFLVALAGLPLFLQLLLATAEVFAAAIELGRALLRGGVRLLERIDLPVDILQPVAEALRLELPFAGFGRGPLGLFLGFPQLPLLLGGLCRARLRLVLALQLRQLGPQLVPLLSRLLQRHLELPGLERRQVLRLIEIFALLVELAVAAFDLARQLLPFLLPAGLVGLEAGGQSGRITLQLRPFPSRHRDRCR